MTYEQARDEAQLLELDQAIDTYIANYPKAQPQPANRQTLILFPGGAGCELKRTRQSFSQQQDPNQFGYDTVWLNCYTLIGGALKLRMERSGNTWVEADGHIIVAGGSVSFAGRTPYDGFLQWCATRDIDVLVYGYDWRRPFDEMADFFVQQFVPRFRTRVQDACNFDPFQNYSLLGHSEGGMLVNWVLRRHGGGALPDFKAAITAGTPFYGYGGQLERWFDGMSLLNGLGKRAIVQVISSMPALYALSFLSTSTYQANQQGLQNDPYPLLSYPSTDAADGKPVDPYKNALSNDGLVRYPSVGITGFDDSDLCIAADVAALMSAPMPDELAVKFYNLRGVLPNGSTAGRNTWQWIQPAFDPQSDASPIDLIEDVPGDGTQPAWTARLLRDDPLQKKNNIIDVVSDDAEHVRLLESQAVQNALASLLGVRKWKKGEAFVPPFPVNVTSFDVQAAVEAMQQEFREYRDNVFDIPPDRLIEFWLRRRATDKVLLPQVAARIYMDLVRPEGATRREREQTLLQRDQDVLHILNARRPS